MSIVKRIVCDAEGKTTGNNFNTIQAKDLYTFYVQLETSVNTGMKDLNQKEIYKTVITGEEITMVLPIGGSVSGIYRFPRVGEKVLVEIGDEGKFLLGYIPSEKNDPFAPVDEKEKKKLLKDGKGMVFRYQQTGKKPEKVEAGEQYSEIGFYHEPTQWEPKSGAVADYAEKDGDFPKIDRINISSTGDLHESTANHHEVRAKRFELYVNCDKDPRNDEKPFGDQNGDDSFLYAGDAHIRAGNRIVIKADEEIRLQVGRSAIVISDKGISIVSKKTKSNIATPWDTALSVTPLEGISMFGTHLKMVAAYDFLLAESFGGSLSSMLGVTRITSKDFKALSSTLVSYVVTGAGVMGTIADVIGSTLAGAVIGTGKHGVSKGSENASVNGLPAKLSLAPELLAFALNINCGFLDADCKDDHDPLYSLLIIQRIAATVLKIVAMVIEMFTPKKNMDEYGGKDGLIATVTIAESGLLIAGFAMIIKNLLTMPATAGHTSYLHLSGNACAALGGFELELMGTRTKHAAGPAAGLAFIMSGYGGMAWDILKKHWGKILIALGVVGSAAAVSFGVAAGVAKDGLMDFVTVAADERAKAQLKEL